MSHSDRKQLIREYKETAPPAGIYRILNTSAGKSLVGSSVNVPGMLNRLRFQLGNGSCPHPELQADWKELGPDAFVFEVLDQLKPPEGPAYDPTDDLAVLKDMWLDKMKAAGEALYP